jgi:predicted O-methyltransferase YrrM
MTQELWSKVDDYIVDALVGHDPALEGALKASDAAGLPHIAVAPNQGKLLHILALAIGARKILEIGTLGGYSTIWLARALPEGGSLITLEYDPAHATVARDNITAAGLADKVEVRVGAALDTLAGMDGQFDLFFIDADKQNNPNYFSWALAHSHPGTLIIVDNVVRGGAIADPADNSPAVAGTKKLYETAAASPLATATAVQTVGSKGYDGLFIARVN